MTIIFNYGILPALYKQRMMLYLVKHQDPGPFLRSLLANDLFEAIRLGSDFDLQSLPALVVGILNAEEVNDWEALSLEGVLAGLEMPWGSRLAVDRWLHSGARRVARVEALRADEAAAVPHPPEPQGSSGQ